MYLCFLQTYAKYSRYLEVLTPLKFRKLIEVFECATYHDCQLRIELVAK